MPNKVDCFVDVRPIANMLKPIRAVKRKVSHTHHQQKVDREEEGLKSTSYRDWQHTSEGARASAKSLRI